MSDLALELLLRLTEIERRVDGLHRHGPVTQVDLENHKVRAQIGGTDDEPMLSPWVPYAQVAGGLAVHTPPTVGQQMTLVSPSGDLRQALAVPMTWSDQVPSPSTGADPAITYGDFRFDLTATTLTITAGLILVTLDKAVGTITLKATKVITDGLTYLGGPDASRPSSAQGTVDTHGDADVTNLATKVFVK